MKDSVAKTFIRILRSSQAEESKVKIKTLHANFGLLTLENDFLEHALTKAGFLSEKRQLTERTIFYYSAIEAFIDKSRQRILPVINRSPNERRL